MNTSEVLDRAADLIEERGWGSGGPDAWGAGPSLCLEGGLLCALGLDSMQFREFWRNPAYLAVADYLDHDVSLAAAHAGAMPAPRQALWRWNDAWGRTAAEVIGTLRACAVIEAAREDAARHGVTVELSGARAVSAK